MTAPLHSGSHDVTHAASAILPDAVAKKLEALVVALGNMLTVTVRALRLRTGKQELPGSTVPKSCMPYCYTPQR